ncbi:NAD(P)-dependent dehydrogenase (short-subunit alcohol dehydrogenase family) [Sphingomonas naasensis]|uniref:SDR family oxidoreductase n=1 Tax=Sphingomonas naasensis TaxID=1344951 RepID=A0A4S1WEI2_9SPHN|nr:SDR family oxidoreductase [Sphingomonas naasensis]NIJ21656.1 NAD(P)-dependent dehydrogenase (short-subunit alcohol dehydrogenase family) [Sphingomonas naasensis]TGX41411.1 SDR family oxidoreductase [Sphingomonas naasensis]
MGMLNGKTALITGASSGIGLAIAEAFASEGAQVVISGRGRHALDAAVARIGAGTLAFEGDAADPGHHRRVAGEISARFGGLDIYVANAGRNTIRNSAAVSEDEYDAQFALNARGVFFGVQAVAPILRDGGAILLTGSLASDKVLEGHAIYAGSKAAIGAFARSWALEFKARGIRVNVLSPGPTDTAILDKLGIPPEQRGAFAAAMADAIPLGRLGRPDELAQAALFLASDASSFVTGVNLRVDGGMALL